MGASSNSRRPLENVHQSCSLCVYLCTHRVLSIGRVDDVLILASGENVVPAPMEDVIMSSPLVGGALIFGRGRNQVGVLLEPRPGVHVDDLVEFRNKIWCVAILHISNTDGLTEYESGRSLKKRTKHRLGLVGFSRR